MGECIVPAFLAYALDGGEWSALRPCRFTTGTYWIGGWVNSRDALDFMENKKNVAPLGVEPQPTNA
jgi:hypothetical protein